MLQIQKIIFPILLLAFGHTSFAQGLTEGIIKSDPTNPIPPHTKLLQEAVWKSFHLKLMLNPSEPYLRGPADFIIEAKKEIMKNPFEGRISIAFENTSKPNSPLQETEVTPEDFEADGIAKISHTFTEAGDYAITAAFTDPLGDLFILRGNVNIPHEKFWSQHPKAIIVAFALFLLVIVFWGYKRKKRIL